MTCIVGLVHNSRVYIGGDSGGLGKNSYDIRKMPKVFTKGQFVYGYAGSFRMGNILQYEFKEPKIKGDIFKYMVHDYINGLRKCFEKHGFEIDSEREADGGEAISPCFFVGMKGKLFSVHEDLQIAELTRSYDAIGCGGDFALGAMYMAQEMDKTPEEKITIALKAATQFSSIYEPFHIVSV